MAKHPGGYTILEVMMFLAISSLIFVGAAVAIGGRQQRVQYTQSVRDFENVLYDAVNDVAAGYYPTPTGIRCRRIPAGSDFRPRFEPTGASPAVEQGASNECISLGKALLFNVDGNDETFKLATLVGVRRTLGDDQVSAKLSNPVVARSVVPGEEFDLTEERPLRFGLRVTGIYDMGPSATSYNAIAIASGFSGASSVKNGLVETFLYGLPGTFGLTFDQYASGLEGLDAPVVEAPSGVVICLTSSSDNKRARIFLGENGSPTNVRSELDVASGVCS